jgi:hypothetical protein
MKINKQVIKDYFGSFFKQYNLNKEQVSLVRSLVDEEECGCCYPTTFYWLEIGDNVAGDPADQQIIFKDDNDNVIIETSLTGGNPQRLCIPREATQICVNIIRQNNDGGSIKVYGDNTFINIADEVGETCSGLNTPVSPFFTIEVVPAPLP